MNTLPRLKKPAEHLIYAIAAHLIYSKGSAEFKKRIDVFNKKEPTPPPRDPKPR